MASLRESCSTAHYGTFGDRLATQTSDVCRSDCGCGCPCGCTTTTKKKTQHDRFPLPGCLRVKKKNKKNPLNPSLLDGSSLGLRWGSGPGGLWSYCVLIVVVAQQPQQPQPERKSPSPCAPCARPRSPGPFRVGS